MSSYARNIDDTVARGKTTTQGVFQLNSTTIDPTPLDNINTTFGLEDHTSV
jgi:hypothetical protein